MQAYLGEFIGTMFLVILGDGVCCNVSLNKSGMKGAGVVHILIGWGMAVMVPAFCFGAMSGSHFNPAVTIGAAIRGGMDWGLVPGYIIAQLAGGFVGAAILMVLYGDHIAATDDDATIRGCFCTGPSIRNTGRNFLSEFFATFILVFILRRPDRLRNERSKRLCSASGLSAVCSEQGQEGSRLGIWLDPGNRSHLRRDRGFPASHGSVRGIIGIRQVCLSTE